MHGEVKVTKPCSAKPAADASLSGRREKEVNRDVLPQAFKTWMQFRVRVGVSEVKILSSGQQSQRQSNVIYVL
jgi:hypothetical protein